MKQTKLLLGTIAMLWCSLTASAHDFEVGGIYYYITSKTDLTVKVTYQGGHYNSYNEYSGAVTIPAAVTYNGKTYSVASIGYSAFRDCSSLTSITIPEGVTSIEESAFDGCSSLTSITIPEGVTSIGDYAFFGCSSLTSITIPEGVTSIGDYAFYGCTSLKELVIADGGETLSLGYNMYDYYGTGEGLFYDCPLETIYLGRNLSYSSGTRYGYSPFYDQKALISVTIGESVTSIGMWAFSGCSSLTSIIVEGSNTTYDSRDNCNAIIETSGNCLIAGCSATIIPESVTSIGDYAFRDCTSLTSITIPESVTSIGSSAFWNCSSLYKVINCSNLGISKGSTAYGYVAYYAEKVLNGSNLSTVGDYQFYTSNGVHYLANYSGNYSNLVLPDSYNGENYKIDDYAFYGCSSLTSITIPASVTSIGNKTFEGCTSLKELVIADGGETLSLGYNMYDYDGVGEGLFYDCPLETIYLGRNLSYSSGTRYGISPFYDQKALTSVTIGESVTSIGMWAFSGCSSLTSITIPEGVTSIGMWAFSGCSSLTSITIPENSKLRSIGEYAFRDCSSLTSITLPENSQLTSIGQRAFSYCSNLTSITIPEGVTSIGYEAFCGCRSLTSITLPENSQLTSIGQRAFSYCSNLTSITIPEGVTSIEDFAFLYCI